jgi:hypothetical protein
MDLSRQQKHLGDSCCMLQMPWDSSEARQIPAFTSNGWMVMSWIDDNAIAGQDSDIMDLEKVHINQFKCKDCGPMDE